MLVRVLEIPSPTGEFHFSGGEAQTFVEVDWFRDDECMLSTDEGREQIEVFIRAKNYFDSSKAYLILHQTHPMTINYSAP